MRIVQINTVVNSGSTGRIAEDIGKVAIAMGHKSYVAYGSRDRPSESVKIKIGSKADKYMHGLETLLFDRHGLGSKKATENLIHTLQQIKPDIIGLHNLHGYYINYDILFEYIKKEQIPVIWTFHDCWPFTGHCTHFERINCEKWKTHCEKCPLYDCYPKSFSDRSFENFEDKKKYFNGVDNLTIVTPSFWLKNLVKQSFLKDYPVKVIHNGIDLKVFRPIVNCIESEKIILGVASRWTAHKGLNDFYKLRKILPEYYQIVLIGLSKNQISKLPNGIKGIERTENLEELVMWYNKALVFVNPTYTDNFPTTNIEALGCGTPVVTYNTGGSPEAIDEETGAVVGKGDIKALSKAIVSIKKNVDMIKACRQRAVEKFNSEDRYTDYLSLYEQTLNNE